jgi:hypothetical protein
MITSHLVDEEILFITYLLEIPSSQRTHLLDIPHEMRQLLSCLVKTES